ncbi:unnamed protein product [Phaedon cochleariae]|uniref:Lethal giant larvae homologue 2 domain-containing protein n=1 Tax=Phaedon cochleariae TaxID=80249 RepID=A0A9N9SIL3_PHACE|nr:unnamed protein product [Phaedon cochleariae]
MCLESAGKHLLLGTEGGNIYLLDLNTFTMTPDIIYQDVVMQNVPQDYKLNPGAVESIFEQPDHPDNILVGYNRGLIVLWNRSDNTAVKTFISNQQLESLCWKEDGRHFLSSHNDGSYMEWNIDQSEKPCGDPVTVYGPYACRAIPKICTKNMNDEPLVAFSGGLPRANYADKYSVSVIHGDKHVAFDFTSKVIDFILIESRTQEDDEEEIDTEEQTSENEETVTVNGGDAGRGEPEALIVLAEEELVAIDLRDDNWKMMNLPYLVSLHASAITCSQYVSGIPEKLWGQLKDAGKVQTGHLYSPRRWPVDGGRLLCSKGATPKRELLLTGHEDGAVRFWDAGGVALTPIYKFGTAQFFAGDEPEEVHPDPEDLEEEWPPFRKTGVFDPYSDDPRLAVKRVTLCPLSGTLLVGGTAGQVVVAKFDTEVLDGPLRTTTMDIVSDRDGFVWKGHGRLSPKQGDIHQPRGFQATAVLQLHPPAAVTCCVLHSDWGLVAAGTAHGLALLDYVKNKPVMVKCTLNPNDLTGAGDTPISRRKSFKKSLRESFRRLRRGRSTRRPKEDGKQPASAASPPARRLPPAGGDPEPFSPLEAKPVERQIEARQTDDSMGSFVRCLYFARTFLVNVQNTNPTLWAGTNSGTVYAFTVSVPATSKRQSDDVACQLAKEIQLKHRAPVIAIAVLDGSHRPLPEPLEVERGVAPLPDTTQPHRVVIASEEQFKIFALPSLKPYGKYKLTAHEGARVRRMAFANFTCTLENTTHSEVDLLCLTNTGDCLVLTIPDLKRQLNAAAIKREDINGISSLVFTKDAQALYLHSSSELQRFSLAATGITMARCYLSLPAGARPDEEGDGGSEEAGEGRTAAEGARREEAAAVVNGGGSKEGSVAEKSEERRSTGEQNDTNLHNVTVSSSVGDITIDSVKDHLSGSGEDLNGRLANARSIKAAVTAAAAEMNGSDLEAAADSAELDIIESQEDRSATKLEVREIQVSDILLRAPIALAEEDS